jgi:pyruvate kinase
MNFSHASYEFHKNTYDLIRKVSFDLNKHIPVVVDLQGPKLRCNDFVPDGYISLEKGENVLIIPSESEGFQKDGKNNSTSVITTPFAPIVEKCSVGDLVLFDDGLIRTTVKEKREKELVAVVVQGGFFFFFFFILFNCS